MSSTTIIGTTSGTAEIKTIISPSSPIEAVLGTPTTISGDVAVTGPPGPPGLDSHYAHVQSSPSSVWVINHELGKYPSVTVVDSSGTEVVGDVEYLSVSSVRVTFTGAFSGKAYLN